MQIDSSARPIAWGLALDLTARAVQTQLKEKGSPWTLAKSFKGACPISSLLPWTSFEDFEACLFKFSKNQTVVQIGSPKNMLFPLKVLLAHLQEHFPLAPGDLILTGTPSGVGPIGKGDHLRGEIAAANGKVLLSATWDVISI